MTTLDQLRVLNHDWPIREVGDTRPATIPDLIAVLLNEGAEKRWLCAVNDEIRDKCAHADWIYATGESKCGPVILWPRGTE